MSTEVKKDENGNPVDFVAINEEQMDRIMTGLRSCTKKDVPELMKMAYMPDDLPPSKFRLRGIPMAELQLFKFYYAMMGARGFIKWLGADFIRDIIAPSFDYYVNAYPPFDSDIPKAVGNMIRIDLIPMAQMKLRAMRRSMEEKYAYRRSN